MKLRLGLAIVGALAAAIAGGTVKFAGLPPDWTQNIIAVAALVGIAVNVTLAALSGAGAVVSRAMVSARRGLR